MITPNAITIPGEAYPNLDKFKKRFIDPPYILSVKQIIAAKEVNRAPLEMLKVLN